MQTILHLNPNGLDLSEVDFQLLPVSHILLDLFNPLEWPRQWIESRELISRIKDSGKQVIISTRLFFTGNVSYLEHTSYFDPSLALISPGYYRILHDYICEYHLGLNAINVEPEGIYSDSFNLMDTAFNERVSEAIAQSNVEFDYVYPRWKSQLEHMYFYTERLGVTRIARKTYYIKSADEPLQETDFSVWASAVTDSLDPKPTVNNNVCLQPAFLFTTEGLILHKHNLKGPYDLLLWPKTNRRLEVINELTTVERRDLV